MGVEAKSFRLVKPLGKNKTRIKGDTAYVQRNDSKGSKIYRKWWK